ncbi:MAG: Zn-ribbon domain-containing OB-fold protein [Candidatus Geothermarchaeales archaeon]
MAEEAQPVEQFYGYVAQRRLMGGKCKNCGAIHIPPRVMCNRCYSTDYEWMPLSGRGRLVTYTVLHVVPQRFASLAPYAFGVVRLEEGVNIAGMIRGVEFGDLKVGMDLVVDFDTAVPETWPMWARFYFKPAGASST